MARIVAGLGGWALLASAACTTPQVSEKPMSISDLNGSARSIIGRPVDVQGWVTKEFGQTDVWSSAGHAIHTFGPLRSRECLVLEAEPAILQALIPGRRYSFVGTMRHNNDRAHAGISCPSKLLLNVRMPPRLLAD
jgi:hypothetical protein